MSTSSPQSFLKKKGFVCSMDSCDKKRGHIVDCISKLTKTITNDQHRSKAIALNVKKEASKKRRSYQFN